MEESYRNDSGDIYRDSINYEGLIVVEGEIENARVKIEELECQKKEALEKLKGIEEELQCLSERLERLVEERRIILEPGG